MRMRALIALALSALAAAPVPSLYTPPSRRPKPPRSRLEPWVARGLYVATCLDPLLCVVANEYRQGPPVAMSGQRAHHPTAAVYRTLFYFARLRPRLLFVVGACLRAFQMTVAGLSMVFDPSAGVGAGVNMLSRLANSRWPAPLLLGWSASKPFWELLGAQTPQGNTGVPVHLSIMKMKTPKPKS